MSRSRAIRSGVSAVFKQPLIIVAELAWSWAFSLAVLLLGVYALLLFLHSLPVSGGDIFGLSGIVPSLFGQTLAHIFHGSGPTMARIVIVLAVGFAALWWMAASLGRAATLPALIARTDGEGVVTSEPISKPALRLRTIVGLHALRVVLGFAGALAYFGAVLLALSVSRVGAEVQVGEMQGDIANFYLMLIPIALVIGLIWSTVSWYLRLAPVVAVSNDSDVVRSILDSAWLSRKFAAQFAWVGFVCGILRLMLYGAAFFVLLGSIGLLAQLPGGIVVGTLALLVLMYSFCSSLINMVKIAAYARIVGSEWEAEWEADQKAGTKQGSTRTGSIVDLDLDLAAPTATPEVEPLSFGRGHCEPPPTPAG